MEKEYQFGTIEQAIADIKAGKMVLVTDDPDRENEGDLIMAADFVTPEAINFMATHAKGLICAPCDGKILDRLQLDFLVTGPGLEAEFPFNRPDRHYLEEELCAASGWRLIHCANQIAIFSRQGGKAYPPSVLPAANWSGYQFKPGPLQWPARQ